MAGYRAVILLALVAGASAARDNVLVRPHELVNDAKLIASVNGDARSKWVAGENAFFNGWTKDEAKKLLGTIETPKEVLESMPTQTFDHIKDEDIPDEFNAMEQWPEFIHPIRNQERCGSCWAFAASEALSDRFAIATNGTVNVVLSPEDMVSCDHTDMGCNGGMLDHAWAYLESTGIVSDSCFPYSAGTGQPAACINKCVDGTPFKKYKVSDYANIKGVENIQKAIMTQGPVEAGFTVYKSFMSYTKGVYEHHWWQVWDQVEGGHAIKIVGWGNEKDSSGTVTPYWLIANSWSENWGEKGFFKMLRGKDECSIESQVFAGTPAI